MEKTMATSPAAHPQFTNVPALLADMTLEEKIGQMTQVEKNSLRPEDVTRSFIGSVLSGGGGYPTPNTPRDWHAMVTSFQEAALATRLRIPLLYGVDAVHGHNNVKGATIFPHNIGLGATRDRDLIERIGRATAEEVSATSVHWNFAPAVTVPQDIRWGRAYEGYSEETALVSELGAAYIRGLQGPDLAAPGAVLGCAKHFLGDGGTTWGSVERFGAADELWGEADRKIGIDQGVTGADEDSLRAIHLPPYAAAIQAGARSVMVSFSSWRDVKMHAHRYLLTDVLKSELGFGGFLISDWMAINQIDPDYYACVVASINAGLDMVMVPFDYHLFITTLTDAVEKGYVPMARIDDAVSRILRVKQDCGLFQSPMVEPNHLDVIGSAPHRALAREAARKSAVLLKNENAALPVAEGTPRVLVAGQGADDLGLQCGGWTIEWMGQMGPVTAGTTLLEALRAALPTEAVYYAADGSFNADTELADTGIVVVAEPPYAEGVGDRANLALRPDEVALVQRVRARCQKLVLVIYSGRPLLLGEELDRCDAVVAAWLPGSEGQGLADVLCGDAPFTGKLSFAWPRSMAQVPRSAMAASSEGPLWPVGFGLK
jgi:beta-glucosidase